MKILNNKIAAITISVLFVLSMAASMILIPNANAHSPPWNLPTYSYVNASPNPVGVGQVVYVNLWLNAVPPTADVQYGDRFENMTVKVTEPSGTTVTLGPFTSDDTGGTETTFIPTQVGNYTFQSFFSGQTMVGANPPPGGFPATYAAGIGDYYEPSSSNLFTLGVQSAPVTYPAVTPLPTTYWSRPINALNNDWYSIAGNWLDAGSYNASGNYNPYTLAPMTSHILWTKPEAFGGTIGGEFGGSEQGNFYSTAQYEKKFTPIIIDGVLYYNEVPGSTTYPAGWAAVNLQTGQTLWTDDAANYGGGSAQQTALTSTGIVTTLDYGQILDYVSPNQYGGLAYLWSAGTPAGITSTGTTYNMFDAMTGDYILSIVNCTAFSAFTEDQNGDLIGYYINSTNSLHPTLCEWNSTLAIYNYDQLSGYDTATGYNSWEWRPPQSAQIPFGDGIEWEAPLATTISGNSITLGYAGVSSGVVLLDQYGLVGGANGFTSGWIVEAGYSSTTGAQLWITNRTETPDTRVAFGYTGGNGNSAYGLGDGAWVEVNLGTLSVAGYSLFTGDKIWGPESLPNANPWSSLGVEETVANGTVFISTIGGSVYSVNILTGTINWQYQTANDIDSPYGAMPIWGAGTSVTDTVAGGLLFLPEGHEFAPPLFHGAEQLQLNITNGQPVWGIEAFDVNGQAAVSDGIMTTINAYDNQIYAYGQGPSKTTVTAPDVGVTTATPVTITGAVTDISAGALQQAVAANFPNGLPCVSDTSMSLFMEAIYEQQSMPTNLTGVPVTLSVTDSNHNTYAIGTTTTDPYTGTYSLTWTPDIAGNFTVTATFAGTNGYYGSDATTYLYASSPTSTTTATPAPVTGLASNTTLMYGVTAIIIVIVIIGAATILVLSRKRP